jgi:hypothetical protein
MWHVQQQFGTSFVRRRKEPVRERFPWEADRGARGEEGPHPTTHTSSRLRVDKAVKPRKSPKPQIPNSSPHILIPYSARLPLSTFSIEFHLILQLFLDKTVLLTITLIQTRNP